MASLCQGALWQKFAVFRKLWHFSPSKHLYRIFWLEFEISTSKLTPVPNFTSIAQKIRELEFWPNTENSLMTSYLPPSDDVSKILMAFERFCPRVPSCQVWL